MPSSPDRVEVEVEGRRLTLSNLDKVLYPACGFTKAAVLDYYRLVAPVLLTHIRGRPLTLKRYPEGVSAPSFYEKACPDHRPPWVRTAEVSSSRSPAGTIRYCLADDLPTLIWLANLAAIELHPLLARVDHGSVHEPTLVVFDLDPGPPAGILESAQVACWVRELLRGLGLSCRPKTSGSKGLQVYVPLNTPHDYSATKRFSRDVAAKIVRAHPELVVDRQDKRLRRGKVLVDWSQNDRAKSTVSAYSLRAQPRPTVSTPLRWEEVESALRARDEGLLRFEAPEVVARVADQGDLFAPLAEERQHLPT